MRLYFNLFVGKMQYVRLYQLSDENQSPSLIMPRVKEFTNYSDKLHRYSKISSRFKPLKAERIAVALSQY
jgi:hypothetical protein